MIGPEPKIGWVLRYSYLWSDEGAADVKDRPAVVVLAMRRAEGRTLVRVAPVTHREPADPACAIEIPAVTKRRLGLDQARSWIILNHANEFVWPGPDIRPVPGTDPLQSITDRSRQGCSMRFGGGCCSWCVRARRSPCFAANDGRPK